MHKTCSKCREDKPITDFYKREGGRYKSRCKKCYNERVRDYYHHRGGKQQKVRTTYGTEYDEMYAAQNGACKICRKNFSRLHVDHDHKTGNVRGLLCHGCNVALGHFQDNVSSLTNAIEYLNNSGDIRSSS